MGFVFRRARLGSEDRRLLFDRAFGCDATPPILCSDSNRRTASTGDSRPTTLVTMLSSEAWEPDRYRAEITAVTNPRLIRTRDDIAHVDVAA